MGNPIGRIYRAPSNKELIVFEDLHRTHPVALPAIGFGILENKAVRDRSRIQLIGNGA